MAQQTIAASGIRAGDKIKKIGSEDVTNKRLVVTGVVRGMGGSVTLVGTSRAGAVKTLVERLMPNLRVVVSR